MFLPFKEHHISREINSSILNISCIRCNPLAFNLPDFFTMQVPMKRKPVNIETSVL